MWKIENVFIKSFLLNCLKNSKAYGESLLGVKCSISLYSVRSNIPLSIDVRRDKWRNAYKPSSKLQMKTEAAIHVSINFLIPSFTKIYPAVYELFHACRRRGLTAFNRSCTGFANATKNKGT
jgi:hypothetical protein